MVTLHVGADTEQTTKALISFARMQCMQQNQFFLCGGWTNKAFINAICGYANREGLAWPAQLLILFRAFAPCIQNIETWVNTHAEI